MKFFDTVEYIKDIFRKKVPYQTDAAVVQYDAPILAKMGTEIGYVSTPQHTTYFYYFLRHPGDLDFARFLFLRNGIPVRKHLSRMNYRTREMLRVSASDLRANDSWKEFVESVVDAYKANVPVPRDAHVRAVVDYSQHSR